MKYNELKEWILKNCYQQNETYFYSNTYSFCFLGCDQIMVYTGDLWSEDGVNFEVASIYDDNKDDICIYNDEEEAFAKLKAIMLDTELEKKPEEKRKVTKI